MADNNYVLLNKDVPVLNFTFAENPNIHTPLINKINEVYNLDFAPLPVVARHKGSRTGLFDLNYWWVSRGINCYRRSRHIRILREKFSYAQYYALFSKSMGRGLTDHYWVKEENDSHTYAEVNFFDNPFPEDLGNLFLTEGDVPATDKMFTPDLTLTGHSFKTWKINEKGERILCRAHNWNREIYNEMAAAEVFKIFGIAHVNYWQGFVGGRQVSLCKNFVTKNTEYICLRSFDSGIKYFETGYLPIFFGSQRYEMLLRQAYQMLLIGYVLNNWAIEYGILRDANTMEVIGMGPAMDFCEAFWNGYDYEKSIYGKVEKVIEEELPLFVAGAGLNMQLLDEVVPVVFRCFADCEYLDEGELNHIVKNIGKRIENVKRAEVQKADESIIKNWSFEKLVNFIENIWCGW